MKKQNKSQQKSRINESATTQSHHNYHPPPHSKKLSKFLEEWTRNKFEIDKKKLEEKAAGENRSLSNFVQIVLEKEVEKSKKR